MIGRQETTINMLLFKGMTQLDLTGPYEVLARLPEAETLLLWKNLDPVRTEHGLTIMPMAALSSCPLAPRAYCAMMIRATCMSAAPRARSASRMCSAN